MDQLQLSWKNMDKEKIIKELLVYGASIQDYHYFLELGTKLAYTYYNNFEGQNKHFDYQTLYLEKTILNLRRYTFSLKELDFLDYKTKLTIYLNYRSYMIISLKNYVLKLVINNKVVSLPYKISIEEVMSYFKNKEIEVKINETLDNLIRTSYIYSYAYYILEDLSLFMAGMFKNAYYDLIKLAENDISEKQKNLTR